VVCCPVPARRTKAPTQRTMIPTLILAAPTKMWHIVPRCPDAGQVVRAGIRSPTDVSGQCVFHKPPLQTIVAPCAHPSATSENKNYKGLSRTSDTLCGKGLSPCSPRVPQNSIEFHRARKRKVRENLFIRGSYPQHWMYKKKNLAAFLTRASTSSET
jgi:hypothetical protein